MKKPIRFWSKVDVGEVDECWEWLVSKSGRGYGQFSVHEKLWRAHRVAWVLTYGPIPQGLLVCHHCDNPGCCNPYHLFLGTQADNMQDATRKGRTARGEVHGRSKLTEDEVLEIRELHTTGEWTQQELANEFDVTQPRISAILRGRGWRHI